jgi:hypothetical protein
MLLSSDYCGNVSYKGHKGHEVKSGQCGVLKKMQIFKVLVNLMLLFRTCNPLLFCDFEENRCFQIITFKLVWKEKKIFFAKLI